MVDISGYENQYAITKDGRVWSHKRKNYLKTQRIYSGYSVIGLRDSNRNQKRTSYFVHRLVALAYIDNPLKKPEVHHKNNKRDDNTVDNLVWVTRSENNQAAWDSGNKQFVKTPKFVESVRENMKKVRASRGNK